MLAVTPILLLMVTVSLPRLQALQIRPTGTTWARSSDPTCLHLRFQVGASSRRLDSNSPFKLCEQRDDQSPVKETDSSEDNENEPTMMRNDASQLIPLDDRQLESDKAVMDRLLLPSRLGNAFTSALWFFVGVGILLNMSGYAYIFDSGFANFRIGTMDERRFREEIVRDMKQDTKRQQSDVTTSSERVTE